MEKEGVRKVLSVVPGNDIFQHVKKELKRRTGSDDLLERLGEDPELASRVADLLIRHHPQPSATPAGDPSTEAAANADLFEQIRPVERFAMPSLTFAEIVSLARTRRLYDFADTDVRKGRFGLPNINPDDKAFAGPSLAGWYLVTGTRCKQWVTGRQARTYFGEKPEMDRTVAETFQTPEPTVKEAALVWQKKTANAFFYWLMLQKKHSRGETVLLGRLNGCIYWSKYMEGFAPAFSRGWLEKLIYFRSVSSVNFAPGTRFVNLDRVDQPTVK